jgi:CO dehydrogenase maturation factor
MRVAVAGKGGSGKTTIAGSLARLLARRGRSVLAVDGDTNPNLAQSLGMSEIAAAELAALPHDLLVRREDADGARIELARPIAWILDEYTAAGPDGIRLLIMGRIDHAGAG